MTEITPELLAEIADRRQKHREEIQRQNKENEKTIQDAVLSDKACPFFRSVCFIVT